jgi:AmmeMemoRadiSam system protein B
VIAPHAGYVYSGSTAGAVFGSVDVPRTCVVLAPNHTGRVTAPAGGSVLLSTRYATPLGPVALDEALADAIVATAAPLLADDPIAHASEHSLEVILPFLQVRNADVCIVPIVIAWGRWDASRALAAALAAAIGNRDDVLVIASSDMNHFESAGVTRAKDDAALERVAALDGEGLLTITHSKQITMCGRVPAAVACEYARLRGGARGDVIAYSHSGMVNGDDQRVVGYAGVLLGVDAESGKSTGRVS